MSKHRRAERALRRLQARAARGDRDAQVAVVDADALLESGVPLRDVAHRVPLAAAEVSRTRFVASNRTRGTRCPNVEQLVAGLGVLRSDAVLIWRLAHASDDGETLREVVDGTQLLAKTQRYVQQLYNDPYRRQIWRITVMLHAINDVAGTHGVEALGPPRGGDYAPPFEYLNAGDPYAKTLIYDRSRDALFLGSWGDVAAAHPEWDPERVDDEDGEDAVWRAPGGDE